MKLCLHSIHTIEDFFTFVIGFHLFVDICQLISAICLHFSVDFIYLFTFVCWFRIFVFNFSCLFTFISCLFTFISCFFTITAICLHLSAVCLLFASSNWIFFALTRFFTEKYKSHLAGILGTIETKIDLIDGSNVAIEHGIQTKGKDWFSVKGLQIAIDYFKNKGHKDIKVVIPRYRLSQNDDRELMKRLEDDKHLVLTPSRIIRGKRVTSYDDRYIIDIAVQTGGVILSNDQYRDLLNESGRRDETINYRLLPFNFVNDLFIVPHDPMGRHGPMLDDFLHFWIWKTKCISHVYLSKKNKYYGK